MNDPAIAVRKVSYLVQKILIYVRNSYHTDREIFAHCYPLEYRGMMSGGCVVNDWRTEFVQYMSGTLKRIEKSERKLYLAMIYEDIRKFRKNIRVLLTGKPVPDFFLHIIGKREKDLFSRLRFYKEGREEAWKFLSEGAVRPKFLFLYALFFGRPLEEILSLFSSVTVEEETALNYSKKDCMITATCLWGTLEAVKYCVETFGREILEPLPFSPILAAGALERMDVLNYFLELGIDVNRSNGDDEFATLSLICSEGFYDVVTLLVEKGADLNFDTDTSLFSGPLASACEFRYATIAKYLIDKGADITKLNSISLEELFQLQKEARWDLHWFIQKYLESYIKRLNNETSSNPTSFFVNPCRLQSQNDIPRRELLVAATFFLKVINEPSEENRRALFSDPFTRALLSHDLNIVFDLFKTVLSENVQVHFSHSSFSSPRK